MRQSRLVNCDAFRVLGSAGLLGWVEETWLGPANEATAFVVRLVDGRRGLLVGDEVAAVLPEDETVVLAQGSRLLRLDPPHLETAADGTSLAASWRTSGETLELPQPPTGLRELFVGFRRPTTPLPVRTGKRERPLWQTIALLYLTLAAIVVTVIGLDALLAYLIAGSLPY